MQLDEDYVPSTIESAINEIYCGFTDSEVSAIKHTSFDEAYIFYMSRYGMTIRNCWSIWLNDTPLKKDAVKTYKIAHADDISSLIIASAISRVRGEKFNEFEWCDRFHSHWEKLGMTSLQAGGISDSYTD